MPVRTFTSFREAETALWCRNPGREYYQMISRFFSLACRLHPPRCIRGIFKFSTIEEENCFRSEQEKSRILSRNT